jgi:hypothetical protein
LDLPNLLAEGGTQVKVEYNSNNSGGSWWLKDRDWKALEKAGWFVNWGGVYFCHADHSWTRAPAGKPEPCAPDADCPGHRRYDSAAAVPENDRWLGALAKDAWKDFDSPADAVREFERVTRQSASDEGCNCCGAPHSFSWDGGYASGEDVISLLYDNVPGSLREAVELLNRRK